MAPHVCVIFNNVDNSSSIGKLSAWAVRTALDANWRVTVMARDLDPALRSEVEWLPMYVPPRAHVLQWMSARPEVWRKLHSRTFDVVHVSQPQLAALADVLHLHFVIDAAARHGSLDYRRRGSRVAVTGAQIAITRRLEKFALRHLPQHLEVVAVSEFLLREFKRINPHHPFASVLEQPVAAGNLPSAATIKAAKQSFGALPDDVVVGFLGGDDPRKGGARVVRELAGMAGVFLLLGGAGSETLASGRFHGRAFGYVNDASAFYAACDVFAAPALFDPAPLTVVEAASHGVVSIGTTTNGSVVTLAEHSAAAFVEPDETLDVALARVVPHLAGFRAALAKYASARTEERQGVRLLDIWRQVALRRSYIE